MVNKRRKKGLIGFILLLVLVMIVTGCGGNNAANNGNNGGSNDGASNGSNNGGAQAVDDKWPERPITIVVGFAPGGGMDSMSRAIAPLLSAELGVDVIVQNREGAGSGVAAEYVNNSPADGYLIFAASSAVSTFPAMANSDVTYNELQMVTIPFIAEPAFQVPADSPYQDMNDLIEALKKGGTTASNTGIGGLWHIPQVLALQEIDGETTYVPYSSGGEAALAVAKGEVDWGTSGAMLESGQYFVNKMSRPLAIFSDKPYNVPGYGEIPAITDFIPGLKDKIVAGAGWRGFAIKSGTPEHIVNKLTDAFMKVLESDEIKEFVANTGLIPGNLHGDDAHNAYIQTTQIQSWLLHDMGLSERSPEELNIPRP